MNTIKYNKTSDILFSLQAQSFQYSLFHGKENHQRNTLSLMPFQESEKQSKQNSNKKYSKTASLYFQYKSWFYDYINNKNRGEISHALPGNRRERETEGNLSVPSFQAIIQACKKESEKHNLK